MTANRNSNAPPLAVRHCKGEADHLNSKRLQRILGFMPLDPSLEIGPTAGAVIATASDLLIRMAQFKDYPSRLVRMLRRWFPDTCPAIFDEFLFAPKQSLDVVVSVQLQRLAWRKGEGSEIGATRWLAGSDVQELLDAIAEQLFHTSIEMKRWHAEMKNWNPARKVAHLATVSRNAIIRRFARWREGQNRALDDAAVVLRKAKRTRWTSLVWKEVSAAERPIGARFGPVPDEAGFQEVSDAAAAQAAPSRSKAACVSVDAQRDFQRRLKDSVAAAQDEHDSILTTGAILVTRQQWTQ